MDGNSQQDSKENLCILMSVFVLFKLSSENI